MSGLYPLSRQQQFDDNGAILDGARLFLFDGGTSTPRIGYRDSALTSAHPNPIVSDSAGRFPLIYLLEGSYRQRLTTKSGTLIFDDDGIPVLSTAAGGTGTSVDPDALFKTRDVKVRFDDQPLAGYVRLNGRTIGSATSGATERANTDTQSLYEELWSYTNISVSGGKGATAAADFAANKALVLPNAAGKGLFGMDDLGAGAQSVLTSFSIANPTLPGSTTTDQSFAIGQTNLPAISLPGTVTASGTSGPDSPDHHHTGSGTTGAMNANASHGHGYNVPGATNGNTGPTAGSDWFGGIAAGTTSPANIDHGHAFTFTSDGRSDLHYHAVTVTGSASTPLGGSATSISKLPPALLLMIYIRL